METGQLVEHTGMEAELTVVVSIVCILVLCELALTRMPSSSLSKADPSRSYVTVRVSVCTNGTFLVGTGTSSRSGWYCTLSVATVGGWRRAGGERNQTEVSTHKAERDGQAKQ